MSGGDERESGEQQAFRRETRAWLVAHKPPAPGFKLPQSFLEVESEAQLEYLRRWQRALYEAGLLGFEVPVEYGGLGRDRERERIVAEELVGARAPFLVNRIALRWVAPTLLAYGTEAQKRRFLKPLLSCDELWCQGFSEPGAGSDLASLRTRAVETQEGFRVTGHKVWTTLAHFASWMILLARTDPAAGKYAGLSYFLFPMKSPGVEVRPLVKLTGEGGFNQVLFEDAPMPRDALLGELGQGWQVAMTTLLFERGAGDAAGARELASATMAECERLVALAAKTRRGARTALEDPVTRDRVVVLWIEGQALASAALRGEATALSAERPLALPLLRKLLGSEWHQRVTELACELLGPDAALWLDDPNAPDHGEWPRAYMNSFGMTIGGGTSEILRNIAGERVLGLPKSK